MTEQVYTFPVGDRWAVALPLAGTAALVNRAALTALVDGRPMPALAELAELCDRPLAEPTLPVGPLRPPFIGLLPTRACNLACGYCDFGASADGGRMPLPLAAAAVTWQCHRVIANGGDTLAVHFFGGEPLLVPEVVETAVHRSRSLAARHGLATEFEVATNGCCEPSVARFAGDYFDTVVLSLDGPAAAHDRQRPDRAGDGSLDRVLATARTLADAPGELICRCCVGAATVAELPALAVWIAESARPTTIVFEALHESEAARASGLAAPDPYLLAANVRRARTEVAPLGVRVVWPATGGAGPRATFCPVGRDVVIVSPDGRLDGCYLPRDSLTAAGLDFGLGRLDADGGAALAETRWTALRQIAGERPGCRDCFCRWSCAGGCPVRNRSARLGGGRSDFCTTTRLLAGGDLLAAIDPALAEEWWADPEAQAALLAQPSDRVADHPWERAHG